MTDQTVKLIQIFSLYCCLICVLIWRFVICRKVCFISLWFEVVKFGIKIFFSIKTKSNALLWALWVWWFIFAKLLCKIIRNLLWVITIFCVSIFAFKSFKIFDIFTFFWNRLIWNNIFCCTIKVFKAFSVIIDIFWLIFYFICCGKVITALIWIIRNTSKSITQCSMRGRFYLLCLWYQVCIG